MTPLHVAVFAGHVEVARVNFSSYLLLCEIAYVASIDPRR